LVGFDEPTSGYAVSLPLRTIARTSADARELAASIVARLYREHAPAAFKLALRYGRGDRQWAEDLVHDVFLEVHRHADRLAEMDQPGGWIYRATTSRCLNRLRRDRWLASPLVRWMLAQPARPADDPERLGAARRELGEVFAAVNRLPDAQRLCFWMRHVDGLTQPEIGEILGFRKSYVCKLLQRAEAAIAGASEEDDHA
jgi:RNA polymerase sigma-70 factor (ECF subfamily)